MKIEGVDFNADFWKGKTFAEFYQHEKHHGLSNNAMGAAYAAINPDMVAEIEAPKEDKPKKVKQSETPM